MVATSPIRAFDRGTISVPAVREMQPAGVRDNINAAAAAAATAAADVGRSKIGFRASLWRAHAADEGRLQVATARQRRTRRREITAQHTATGHAYQRTK